MQLGLNRYEEVKDGIRIRRYWLCVSVTGERRKWEAEKERLEREVGKSTSGYSPWLVEPTAAAPTSEFILVLSNTAEENEDINKTKPRREKGWRDSKLSSSGWREREWRGNSKRGSDWTKRPNWREEAQPHWAPPRDKVCNRDTIVWIILWKNLISTQVHVNHVAILFVDSENYPNCIQLEE